MVDHLTKYYLFKYYYLFIYFNIWYVKIQIHDFFYLAERDMFS